MHDALRKLNDQNCLLTSRESEIKNLRDTLAPLEIPDVISSASVIKERRAEAEARLASVQLATEESINKLMADKDEMCNRQAATRFGKLQVELNDANHLSIESHRLNAEMDIRRIKSYERSVGKGPDEFQTKIG